MISPASSEYKRLPSFKSHSMAVPSLPPDAHKEPSGETVTVFKYLCGKKRTPGTKRAGWILPSVREEGTQTHRITCAYESLNIARTKR